MTITLELTDEQARRLEARAAEHGLCVEDYLLSLAVREPLPYEEWKALLDDLPNRLPRKLPVLPPEAFSRATMYRD
ncbi:MAG: hypothetical protein ACR2GR_10920 [Rhodothermales bacterium]